MNTLNFIYFTANFTHGFISLCWIDNPNLAAHLQMKLNSMAVGHVVNSGAFLKWFFELSRNNQVKLIEWVNINYKGI